MTNPQAISALDPLLYQDMRWCANCGGEKVSLPIFEFDGGRLVVCLGCGEEKVVPFSRAVSEAA